VTRFSHLSTSARAKSEDHALALRRRSNLPNPKRPAPKSARVAGSGTVLLKFVVLGLYAKAALFHEAKVMSKNAPFAMLDPLQLKVTN